jgi:hypothetical protein
MELSPTFFGGDASDLGHVRKLPPRSFRQLVDEVFNLAVSLNVTREQYANMDPKARQKAKRVPYVVPCTFDGETSPRHLELAVSITLICLDIDEPELAKPYHNSPETLAEQLMPFNFAVHTTASSIPSAPRLRILVEAAHLPLNRYKDALDDLAGRIGLIRVNKESRVAVQPMYLPTIFKGETQHPLIISETGGRAYREADICNTDSDQLTEQKPSHNSGAVAADSVDDLDYLRPIVDEISLQDVASALKHIDPDCTYPEWLEIAAAMRHQFQTEPNASEAFKLFDDWSSQGSKYAGDSDTTAKWRSLKPNIRGRVPVTIRSLLSRASANGWDANPTKARCYAATLAWISGKAGRDPMPASQLVNEGLRRIAATPLLTVSEEESLMQEIAHAVKQCNPPMKIGVPVLRKDLRRMKAAAADKKRSKAKLPEWCKGMAYASKMNTFIRPSTTEYFSPEALDRVYGSHLLPTEEQMKESGDQSIGTKGRPVIRPQDYLLNIVGIPTAYDVLYDPSQPNDTFIHHEGKVYVNVYVRNYPEPDPLRAEEAGKIFMDHLKVLVAEESYRRTLLDYLAHIVQKPGHKIRWAVLLQGAQGCGKTVLAEAMRAVLGKGQVMPIDSSALRSTWNDWAYGTQLVVLEEVRVVGQNRHDVMNSLKPLISNDVICVNQRFRDTRMLENRTNYLLFTNHHDALALSAGDRRYFVLKSALQTKAQVQALGTAHFDKLFRMLRDNAAGLRAWLEEHRISDDFAPDGHAPMTTYLQQLVNDAASDTTSAVRIAVEDSIHPLVREDLISSATLMEMLDGQGLQKITSQHLASVLREDGWLRVGRWTLQDGQKHPLWVKADSEISASEAQAMANQRIKQSESGNEGEEML